jgi:hypothetical protein
MVSELERMQKAAVMSNSKYYSSICLEELRNATKKRSLWTKI